MISERRIATAAPVLALSAAFLASGGWPGGSGAITPARAQSADEILVAADGSGDYTSLQSAVEAARDGDTIAVLPGTYEGRLDILADITIDGRGAREDIVVAAPRPSIEGEFFVDGPDGTIVLQGVDATISGLTIRDGGRDGEGGIVVIGGSPTLIDLSVGSISMSAATDAIVQGSLVRNDIHISGGNASVRGDQAGSVSLEHTVGSIVEGNEVGSIWIGGSGAVVRDNKVGAGGSSTIGIDVSSRSSDTTVGIDVSSRSSDTTVEGNTVEGKSVGIAVRGSAPVTLRGNSVKGARVGLILGNANAEVEGNTFCGNPRDVVLVGGVDVDLGGNEICEPAPIPSIDPALVPDADGFVFQTEEPGVRRLLSDGAGHFPSAPYIVEARDMDAVAVGDDGSVMVWSTTHGIDNELAGDQQLWILGQEGVQPGGGGPRDPGDGTSWAGGERAATDQGLGTIGRNARLGAGPDGTLWAIVLTGAGRQPARFEGGTWTVFGRPPGPRNQRLEPGQVAPDGSLWARDSNGRGITRFDGRSVERFLADYEVNSVAITPDGRVWVSVQHRGRAGAIFVIERAPDAIVAEAVGDPDLAARFPAELGGQSLDVRTMRGAEWLGSFDSVHRDGAAARRLITEFVDAAGASIDVLTIGFASHEPSPGNHAAVAAVRVVGTRGEAMTDGVIGLLLANIEEPVLTPLEIAGKPVLRITDARIPGSYPHYAYAAEDAVWVVEAEEPTLSEIFAALP